jgi:hypothetical protein
MENQEHAPPIDGEALAARVQLLRKKVVQERTHLLAWQDALVDWDKAFKLRLEERFGSRRFVQQVPAWQKLVGGTPEIESDITAEQRAYILREVQKFIDEFSATYDITID